MVWVQSERELRGSFINPGSPQDTLAATECITARDWLQWLHPGERPPARDSDSCNLLTLWLPGCCLSAEKSSVLVLYFCQGRISQDNQRIRRQKIQREIHNVNTKHTPTHFRGQHNRKHTFAYLVDTAPLTIFLFLRQDLECCQYNNGCSQLSKLEELNMRDERRNGLKNILNEYLGQTMLAKIFPCRADVEAIFFLHQFQIQFSPILDKFPNCTKILVVRWGFTRSVDTKHDFYH